MREEGRMPDGEGLDVPGRFEVKAFEFKLDDGLSEEGEFSGFAAVYGNVDGQGDVIERGAFRRSIQHRQRVPVLWQHLSGEPIGVSITLAETEHGLHTRGRLVLEVQRAREAHELLKAKALNGLSIGYQVVRWEPRRGEKGEPLRTLKEVRLWEYSLVTFPANELALVGDVKADPERFAASLAQLHRSDPVTAQRVAAELKRLLEKDDPTRRQLAAIADLKTKLAKEYR